MPPLFADPSKTRRSTLAVLARLWAHMGPHKKIYVAGSLLSILDAACQAVIPRIFGTVLELLKDHAADFLSRDFWPILALCIGLTCIFFPVAYFQHVLVETSVIRLVRDMRIRLYEHVQRMSADFFQRHKVGEIAARLNNDMDTMGQSLQATAGLFWQIIIVSQSLLLMLFISLPLTGLFVLLMIVVAFWGRFCLPRLRRISRSVRDRTGEVSAVVTEYVAINDLIKSFNREDFASARVEEHTDALRLSAERLLRWQYAFGDSLQILVRFLSPFTILLVGAIMFVHGRLKIGDLVSFWGYWLIIGNSINMVLRNVSMIFTATASADRIFDFFDSVPLIHDAPAARDLDHVKGEILFQDVTFRYPAEQNQIVIDRLNLHIPAGKVVALVGPSGAGKSTILQLLLRFYDPGQGAILIDGRDIRTVTQSSLRRRVGAVMQESVFFAGTIEENLRLAKPDATPEELKEALAHANALEFVADMPNGLQTLLGERGVRLSGGQKQRLSIARVFLKNPPILLLDEATSALDSVSEGLVQAAMTELMKRRTTIVVAHRISTVLGADEIFVLDQGRLIASGSHHQLLDLCPTYLELCVHQQIV